MIVVKHIFRKLFLHSLGSIKSKPFGGGCDAVFDLFRPDCPASLDNNFIESVFEGK